MLTTKIHTTIAALVAVLALVALTTTGAASAANRQAQRDHHQPNHRLSVSRAVQRTGKAPIVKPVVAGGTFAAISAFPTGGKGSGTEATCALWSGRLNEEQGEVDAAVHNNDLQQYKDAKEGLDEDIDNALDAGCVVID